MKAKIIIALVTASLVLQALAGSTQETSKQRAARMAWWSAARFGMFIHWDMSSMAGTEISWSRKGSKPLDITGDPAGYVEDSVYDHLYEKFNPKQFNAKQWVRLAQDAGMKYIVFTAKHHGGFCMWDTKLTDYSIMHTPFHRDVVKELADACHAAGMRFGIYYSPRDWHNPDYGMGDGHKYVDYMNGQLRELLSHYGKIDVLWLDSYGKGDAVNFWHIPETYKLIKSLQPDIILNNRLAVIGDKPAYGDFDTPEQRVGAFQDEHPWESCMSLVTTADGGGWSYRPDGKVKSLTECLHALVSCAGGDGNLLLDVGPNSLGEIPADQAIRLREMGAWLEVNGRAIYGTRGSRLGIETKWGRVTQKGNMLYLLVTDWPTSGSIGLSGLQGKVSKAWLLANRQPLNVEQTGGDVSIALPASAPERIASVVCVRVAG